MSSEDKKLVKRALIVILAIAMLMFAFIKATESRVEAWEPHTVQYGDTLWDIAQEYNPDYNGDIWEVIYYMEKANGMKSSTVYVGHVLEVPVMEVE